jgi:hypothetical protein
MRPWPCSKATVAESATTVPADRRCCNPRDDETYRQRTEMVQPVAFHVVMLSSLAPLFLAQGRVLYRASGPVDGDRSVTIPLETKGGARFVY